jgi:hypothetical protein
MADIQASVTRVRDMIVNQLKIVESSSFQARYSRQQTKFMFSAPNGGFVVTVSASGAMYGISSIIPGRASPFAPAEDCKSSLDFEERFHKNISDLLAGDEPLMNVEQDI